MAVFLPQFTISKVTPFVAIAKDLRHLTIPKIEMSEYTGARATQRMKRPKMGFTAVGTVPDTVRCELLPHRAHAGPNRCVATLVSRTTCRAFTKRRRIEDEKSQLDVLVRDLTTINVAYHDMP